MTATDFLPVDVLLKVCRSVQQLTHHESESLNLLNERHSDGPDTPLGYFESRLLPALEPSLRSLLAQVVAKDVLLKPHSSFNALHCLSLQLYRNNPAKPERIDTVTSLDDIAWVTEQLKSQPQAKLPLSWHLTRAEAATIIQKHWRGYSVRRQAEVQELRKWQQQWRMQNEEEKS